MRIGTRIDLTKLPYLEIDDYLIVHGNLTVYGTETIYMTTIIHADQEIRDGYYLKLYDSDNSNYAGLHHDGNKLVIDLDGTGKLSISDSEVTLSTNLNIGDNKIKTTNLLIREAGDGVTLLIRDVSDSVYRQIKASKYIVESEILWSANTGIISTNASDTASITLRSYTTEFVDNLKISNGVVEIYNGKLTSKLDANSYHISNLPYIEGRYGNYGLNIISRRTAEYAGDALSLLTYNASNVATDRLVIAGGVDTAEIKILNSNVVIDNGLAIRTIEDASAEALFQSYNGSAYVNNLRLIGGYVEILDGKLMSELKCNEKGLANVSYIKGKNVSEPLILKGLVTSANAGDAIKLQTKNASDVDTDRLVITGGVDTADIKVDNANLIPAVDNAYNLGSSSYRWANLYAVTTTIGDLVFDNDWRITEDEEYGIILVSPDGRKYRFMLEEVN